MAVQDVAIPKTITQLIGLRGKFEIFIDKSTDANGELTINLSETPASVKKILVVSATANRIATIKSLSGKDLTLTIYKTQYLKATATTGSLTGLPSGVTEQSTLTSTVSASLSTTSATADVGGGSVVNQTSHSHQVNHIYSHNHSISTTATDLIKATNESETINLIVFYQY
ncbi:hypothetical protein DRN69_08175 [Candidatus Pacearchaeota archaeon]|nr:MAG: hypothetical protein DRN69_08175 [Candidatus Pacearchaeota archaeon]